MPRQWWNETVGVYLERGRIRWVSHTSEAAEVLLHHWPERFRSEPESLAAREACLRSLERRAFPDSAREAFIRAAQEAEIHMEGRLRSSENDDTED